MTVDRGHRRPEVVGPDTGCSGIQDSEIPDPRLLGGSSPYIESRHLAVLAFHEHLEGTAADLAIGGEPLGIDRGVDGHLHRLTAVRTLHFAMLLHSHSLARIRAPAKPVAFPPGTLSCHPDVGIGAECPGQSARNVFP